MFNEAVGVNWYQADLEVFPFWFNLLSCGSL